jgi:predicted amidophosphoribosyltransferase
MKFCPQCGSTFEPGSRFCQECGFDTAAADMVLPEELKPLMPENLKSNSTEVEPPAIRSSEPVPVSETKLFCPDCGVIMDPVDVFCPDCGFKTADNQPLAPEAVPVPPAEVKEIRPEPIPKAEPIEVSSNKLFCPNCGITMEPEDAFCQECGYNTSDVQPPAPEAVKETLSQFEEIRPEPIPEAAPAEVSNNKQFCPECGAAMEPDDVFCQDCGHRTDGKPEVPAATIKPPGIEEPVVIVAPPPPPPLPPTVKPPVNAQTKAQANQAASPSPGKKKGLLVILLAILALAVIGAGSWFAYDKLIKKPAAPAVDTAAMAIQQEPVRVAEPEILKNTNNSVEPDTEMPNTEPQKEVQKPTQSKQATTKKTVPKKQPTEPPKTEPQTQEPQQSNEPLKVKMKSAGVKTSRTILSIYNENEVKSGPLFASKLKLDKAFIITKITTYHYNWGKGAQPGTISLQKRKEIFGPWQTGGIAGDDGTPNAKWVCEPNERLEEGTYKVEVSDEKSWSYNGQSGQKGFVVIEGYEAD